MTTQHNTATPVVSKNAPFTYWRRGMYSDPRLTLIVANPDPSRLPVEWRELDIRSLADRPELIARMSDRMRDRLLKELEHSTRYLRGVPMLGETVNTDLDPAEFVMIPVTLVANCREAIAEKLSTIEERQNNGVFL